MQKYSWYAQQLFFWYKKNARDLPWRKTKDPYKIWISEIMLQQTTVNAVIPYYERWIKDFPDVRSVAKARLPQILKLWEGLGYYQRAKNIHRSAQIIVEQYDGRIPSDPEILQKLPGFGPYTTGAVSSIAFDLRHPIIDANVRRVFMRQLAIRGSAAPSTDVQIREFLNQIMPETGNNIFNQALMEIGALICRARNPLCAMCPIRETCEAYRQGIQEIIPPPRKTILKNVDAVVAVIEKDGEYLIQKRSSKGLLADLWEFPGGKIEKGESPEQALAREIKEELGVRLKSAKLFSKLEHFYTQFRVKLSVFHCNLHDYPSVDRCRKWVSLRNLSKYPMPSGSVKIFEQLEKSTVQMQLDIG